jgi:symplekin
VMIQSAMRRIFAAGTDGAAPSIWVPLVARLITRGLKPVKGENEEEDELGDERREGLRRIMFEFVVADLHSR